MMKLCAVFAVLLLFPTENWGQTQDNSQTTGLIPYQTYQGGDVDTVNLSNGALSVRIPLLEYPQVGGKLKLGFSFVWTGKAVTDNTYCTADVFGDESCYSGWQSRPNAYSYPDSENPLTGIVDDQDVKTEEYQFVDSPPGEGYAKYYNILHFDTSDGAVHPAIDVPSQANSLAGQRTIDGTNFFNGNRQLRSTLQSGQAPIYYDCTISCYTAGPDGIIYHGPLGIRQDSNGNAIQLTDSGYIDTANRTIPVPGANMSTTGDRTGCTGRLPIYAVSIWQPPTVNSSTLTYKFCYVEVDARIDSPNLGIGGTYIQSIVLPSGRTWTFDYNVLPDGDPATTDNYGELSKITYPTGGTVSFHYSYSITNDNSLAVSSRTVNDGIGGDDHTWTYTYSNTPPVGVPSTYNSDIATTVTDPLANKVVHIFDGPTGTERYTQFYDHADSLVHKSVMTAYQSINVSELAGIGGSQNLFPTSRTTTLDDGTSSLETMSYCPSGSSVCGFNYSEIGGGGGTASFGKVAQHAIYDYASSGAGALLANTVTRYRFQEASNSGYLNANLLDLISSSTVSDTIQRAQTAYGYDEAGLGPAGQLGNQTSVARWLNTGGSVNSTTSYNTHGMPTLLTDPNLNQTYIGYECSDTLIATVIKAYQSTTTLPETSSYYHDCASGRLTGITDPNSVFTSYDYDYADRLSYTKHAVATVAENWTAYSYPNATQVSVTQDKNATGDGILHSATFYDGLGRTTRTVAPSGAMVDTTYDAVGLVSSVSNPHFSTDNPVYGTSYKYDALGRVRYQCEPDNGTGLQSCAPGASYQETSYAANVTSSYDELRHPWQRTTDALGRLTNVVEPGNLITAYSYDVLGNLTSVNQQGDQTLTARNRNFTYDSLSRLICASNPENSANPCPASATTSLPSGVTGYGYDANGNLVAKTDSRGSTTSYAYDALNRFTRKTYTLAGVTATTLTSCYQYDTGSSGLSNGNFTGRLTNEWTQTGTTCNLSGGYKTLRSILAYDPMGRIKSEQQCHLHICTTSKPHISKYDFDLAGNMTAYTNGIQSHAFTYAYDSAGRLQTLGSSVVDSTHPAMVFSGASYTAAGSRQNFTLGTQINVNRTYDNRLRPTSETATQQ